jgi:hypothetical protein
MKSRLVLGLLIAFVLFFGKGASANDNFLKFKKVIASMGFLETTPTSYDNGFIGHKFYREDSICVVSYIVTPEGRVVCLVYEFQDDLPKKLVINLIDETLFSTGLKGVYGDYDLLGDITTCRTKYSAFSNGSLEGIVLTGNYMGIPTRKIEIFTK